MQRVLEARRFSGRFLEGLPVAGCPVFRLGWPRSGYWLGLLVRTACSAYLVGFLPVMPKCTSSARLGLSSACFTPQLWKPFW